ncbi:MAG: NfeD family protein [Solirubrobacterales bacterium]|nr:NfeD family protein [Solirubrobacterales bacterium]MBV9717171.1 NfeD family protein [Solirubrobacterales bacterium]
MSGWLLWVLAACVFGIGEMVATSFFLAPFALGAAVAAVLDAVGAGGLPAWLAFVAVSVLTLVVLRPIAVAHMRAGPQLRTGAAALIGKQATVLETISNRDGEGCVRIDGEVWTARAFDEDRVIERGARVEVVEIKGATALVME